MADASANQEPKFAPAFAMPVIAPPPPAYSLGAAAYYAEVATQTAITAIPVEILPEQLLPPTGSLHQKGLFVTMTNPANSFQPATPLPSVLLPQPSFSTLFALMGGELRYSRATAASGLNALLPPPFDAIATPVKYPAPPGLSAASWGTLVLRVWGTDLKKMKDALKDSPPCSSLFYLGVDEASLAPLLKPVVKQIYPEQAHLDHIAQAAQLPAAQQKKPPLREVVEAIRSTAYAGGPTSATPSYATLIDDYFDAFLNGATSLLVRGGTPIAKAVEVNAGMLGPMGRVELWFVGDNPPAFISPVWLLGGAQTYDF